MPNDSKIIVRTYFRHQNVYILLFYLLKNILQMILTYAYVNIGINIIAF